MDKNEIPRSSGGASKDAPPIPLTAQVAVSWTRPARRVPISRETDTAVETDTAANTAQTRQIRSDLNRAVKRAVRQCLRQAPLKISLDRLQVFGQSAEQAVEVDVSFVSDDEIAELNSDYRGRPRPTDVLSFSQWENEELVPMILADAQDEGSQRTPVPLGDIVISIDTALRQSVELKHDLLTEVTFLAVHGTLHLCGYDHGTTAERRVMWKWQEKIVASLIPSATPAPEVAS